MRTLPALFAIVCLSTALFACKDRERTVVTDGTTAGNGATAQTPPATQPPAPPAPPLPVSDQVSDSLVFSLERGACFGTCPFYQLHIYKGGFATYNGLGHVERLGMHHGKVDQGTIDQLIKEAEIHGFFEMDDVYDSPVTDLPSTTITARRNGTVKQVKGRIDPPESFRTLTSRIEAILAQVDWQPVAPQD